MKQTVALLTLFLVTLIGRVADAANVFKDEDKGISVNVGLLLQPWFQVTMPGSNGNGPGACGTGLRNRCSLGIGNARGDGPSFDFFVRRARLLFYGNASKELAFFFETDEANLGKGGSYGTTTFVQDAFLSYTLHPLLKVDAGLFLAPLSHQTLEGATSQNALDYHSDMIRFPAGRVWRDVGVQLRGTGLPGDHLHYRVAIFEGVRNGAVAGAGTRATLNPGGVPRVTAQLRGNILGSEPDFFFKGIYFAEKPIVTVGLGVDWQANSALKCPKTGACAANATSGPYGDYIAGSLDAFAEIPFTPNDELLVKANYYYYGEGTVPGTGLWTPGASTAYAEVGFRHAWIEPLVYGEVTKVRRDQLSVISPHVGVNFWITKYTFNVKTDFGYKRTEPKSEPTRQDILWTTQAQLFF